MGNAEHYFENLLFHGQDVTGDINKKYLSKEVQETVEICAQYVVYTLFCGREDLKHYLNGELDKCFEWEEHNHNYANDTQD